MKSITEKNLEELEIRITVARQVRAYTEKVLIGLLQIQSGTLLILGKEEVKPNKENEEDSEEVVSECVSKSCIKLFNFLFSQDWERDES